MRYRDITEGIEVWHGSPHTLTAFSLDKIGSGEGGDAYGWGLYFASVPEVANYYRRMLTTKVRYRGRMVDPDANTDVPGRYVVREIARAMIVDGLEAPAAIEKERDDIALTIGWMTERNDGHLPFMKACAAFIQTVRAEDFQAFRTSPGNLYAATIPDGPYLLWDKPFREQPRATKIALNRMKSLYTSYLPAAIKDNDTGEVIYRCLGNFNRNNRRVGWGNENKQSSLDLLKFGIVGIAYLDGNSRTAGYGSLNYVVFDASAVTVRKVEE